jgi:argininosuccinate synthase
LDRGTKNSGGTAEGRQENREEEVMPRYVLAYSGGLDTSVMLKWLQEKHGAEVVTLTANLGQRRELIGLREKAIATGAAAVYIEDLRDEFVEAYLWPSLKAGALYQGVYPLATALGRPLIARRAVEVAREVGADAIVHGCTGKGNDQVRIEVSVSALAPELRCLAPLRDWELRSREEEIAWALSRGIPVEASRKSPYSIDENLWGVAIEAGALEDPWAAPPGDCWRLTVDPRLAPDEGTRVEIAFEEGIPRGLDGRTLPGPALIEQLNEIAGSHGVGRLDVIEDRLVGIKSREVYEAPAAVTLHAAREALEQLTLDRETRRAKGALGQDLARLIYDGLWFTPLRRSIAAFVDEASRPVTGEVRLRLFKGTVVAEGRRSPNALYDHSLATYGEGDAFKHGAAAGFIEIFGLGARTANARAPGSARGAGPGRAPADEHSLTSLRRNEMSVDKAADSVRAPAPNSAPGRRRGKALTGKAPAPGRPRGGASAESDSSPGRAAEKGRGLAAEGESAPARSRRMRKPKPAGQTITKGTSRTRASA